jgi:hypothetical protein
VFADGAYLRVSYPLQCAVLLPKAIQPAERRPGRAIQALGQARTGAIGQVPALVEMFEYTSTRLCVLATAFDGGCVVGVSSFITTLFALLLFWFVRSCTDCLCMPRSGCPEPAFDVADMNQFMPLTATTAVAASTVASAARSDASSPSADRGAFEEHLSGSAEGSNHAPLSPARPSTGNAWLSGSALVRSAGPLALLGRGKDKEGGQEE